MTYDVWIEISVTGQGTSTVRRSVKAPDMQGAIAQATSNIVLIKVIKAEMQGAVVEETEVSDELAVGLGMVEGGKI